ncbi:FORKED 1 protein [Tanacetum coccineum]|uniref:FORKED 1 protein n=1 Tax=Tanacetum coccineum TaxID=301880 RepID=A0ABQ5A7S4_9ASTR
MIRLVDFQHRSRVAKVSWLEQVEINIEVNRALFTVKNKSNLRLQLTVLTKLSCRWITHNYVLHSMPADFELGVADVGVALAAATAASSGHWMDQILKTHCSLLIYESIFEETTQPLFTIARGGYGASRSNTPAGNTVGRWLKERRKKQETRAHNAQLHATLFVVGVAATVATFTCQSMKSILNRLDRGRNSSLSEMQVETELSPGECIGWASCIYCFLAQTDVKMGLFLTLVFAYKTVYNVVTSPGIVEVEVPSAFVVVLATGLKEFLYSMTSTSHSHLVSEGATLQ